MPDLSIIVPVFNEAGNIEKLVKRISNSMKLSGLKYQIIFVDDNSTDSTRNEIDNLIKKFPIFLHKKTGPKGKAYSILEGSKLAESEYIAMIDGDLQYPPEAIPELYKLAQEYGMAVANRKKTKTSFIRKTGSKLNTFLFGRLLLGFRCDVQSGLKVFKKEIISHINPEEITAWTLDMPLLHTARELGYEIATSDIVFEERSIGKSKVNFLKASMEIGGEAIKLKVKKRRPYVIAPNQKPSMIGAGIVYKKKRFITHTTLNDKNSALFTVVPWQRMAILTILSIFLFGLILNAWLTLMIIVAILSLIYFSDMCFNLWVLFKSLQKSPELSFKQVEIDKLIDKDLPIYSILCPLYKESAVLPHFVESIQKLDWPKKKLDVLLLLEENDTETIDVAKKLNLPSYIRIIVVPHSMPKTKPKACNYGLSLAKGEYVVIFDAEDRPNPLQLKKAYLGFQKVGPKVFCLQSKLNYYNSSQNFLTRLFTAEYSLWFDVTLPGLQSIETTIPLGGTSNHFRKADLIKLEGWDPFNVTEDCDLGVRLFRQGYKTAIIDSTTYEEATSHVRNWIRQRSRWIKGYLQTYLVHTREPFKLVRENGIHALILQLIIGMRVSFILINPFLWLTTISYFLFHKYVGAAISSLYPAPVFYIAVTSLVLGNFVSFYSYMIGLAKRGQWNLLKYTFLIPLYWIITSFASYIAFYQLIFKPYYWEKTKHGFNFEAKKEIKKFEITGVLSGGILVGATIGANFFNFAYNTYLGRELNTSDFGTIGLIGGILYAAQILIGAVSRTITYKSGFLSGKYGTAIKSYWANIRQNIVLISVLVSLIWILVSPLLASIFQTGSVLPFLLFTPVWVVGLIGAADTGFLSGNLFFIVLGISSLLMASFKFIFAFLFVRAGLKNLVYVSVPLSMFLAFLVNWLVVLKSKTREKEIKINKSHINFPRKFFATAILTNFSSIAFLSLDVILAKAYLSPTEAGFYTVLSLTGQMIYFIGTLFSQFIAPFVSRAEGAGTDSKRVFYKLLGGTILASTLMFFVLGVFGTYSVPLLFGNKAFQIIQFLPEYGLAMIFFSIALNIVSYHQLRKQYIFPFFSFLLSIAEFIALAYFHTNLSMFVHVMFAMSVANLICFFTLHFSYKTFIVIGKNIKDLSGLFLPVKIIKKTDADKLKILIFNWRDTKHIWAGGAEIYLHEIAKRWAKEGTIITFFCGNDGKNSRYETVEGVNIIRRGGFYTVYFWAFFYYIFKLRGKFDLIIDSENGVPFFTPIYIRKPIVTIIYHIHQEVFMKNLNYLSSKIARFLEARLMPAFYKNSKIVTISNSTKENIEKIKIGNSKEIEIVFPGVNLSSLASTEKSDYPSILYLGRLKPYKSIDTIIRAMPKVLSKHPQARLIIAGFGESRTSLEKLVKEMKLEKFVEFVGRVSEKMKVKLMGEAWVFCQPSLVEGWGISVIEANACGTPVVASNVAGLKDSVQNPETGYLVEYGNPDAFSEKINLLLGNSKLRKKMEKDSIEWAKNFSWENSSKKLFSIIKNNI